MNFGYNLYPMTFRYEKKMISIDSYKIACNIDVLKDIDLDKFDYQEKRFAKKDEKQPPLMTVDKTNQKIWTIDKPGYGIKRIELNENTNRIILQGSAKTLRDQYNEGINLNTWERLMNAYNDTGCIQLNPDKVLQSGELFTVDVSINMKMDHEPWKYIQALKMLKTSNRYEVKDYRNPGSRKVNGITIRGTQRSFKERQIYYDKQIDVAREPELRKYADEYHRVLRAEMNLAQLRRIRHYFGNNGLVDVLNSKTNANLLLFEKITSKASVNLLRLFDDHEGMPMYQVEKIKGRETIIRDICLMDWDLVTEWIKSKIKGKPSRYMKEYRTLFLELMNQQEGGRVFTLDNPLLNELKTKMKVA